MLKGYIPKMQLLKKRFEDDTTLASKYHKAEKKLLTMKSVNFI